MRAGALRPLVGSAYRSGGCKPASSRARGFCNGRTACLRLRDCLACGRAYGRPYGMRLCFVRVPRRFRDAWRSGGCNWSVGEWRAFYNDADNLNYLPASENLAKSDLGPADWAFDCAGILQWIATKARWGLHSDARERAALERGVGECEAASSSITQESTRRPAPIATSDGSTRRSYEKNCNGRWEDIGKPGYFGRCYE